MTLNRQDRKTLSNAMNKEQYEYLANQIFQSALEVHKYLGPGLLESVYEYALVKELQLRTIEVLYQVKVPLFYKGNDTGKEFFIDILVENEIVIEVKSVDALHPVHQAQLLSYLKLSDKRLGFLINFNVALIKDGFKRMVNNY
ncbi:MAG: GxxExxY protein [Chitinophagaceae bacterium]